MQQPQQQQRPQRPPSPPRSLRRSHCRATPRPPLDPSSDRRHSRRIGRIRPSAAAAPGRSGDPAGEDSIPLFSRSLRIDPRAFSLPPTLCCARFSTASASPGLSSFSLLRLRRIAIRDTGGGDGIERDIVFLKKKKKKGERGLSAFKLLASVCVLAYVFLFIISVGVGLGLAAPKNAGTQRRRWRLGLGRRGGAGTESTKRGSRVWVGVGRRGAARRGIPCGWPNTGQGGAAHKVSFRMITTNSGLV